MSKALDNYVRASIPEPYVILGVRLKPYSLGHYFLMKRFDCAFATENTDTNGGIQDLLLGLAICSRSYQEFLDFINDPEDFYSWTEQWGKEVKKILKQDKNYHILEKFVLFQKYMRDGITVPKYFEGDQSDNAKESGAHWTQSIQLVLISELGYTQQEAMDMPLSKAIADYFKWAENNGMVTLMNDDELEIVEQIEGQSKA